MRKIRIALIGAGKIARDQHVPALLANPAYELVAAVSLHSRLDGLANYTSTEELLEANPDVDAVAICTPPQVRARLARFALRHGLHVLLEKPPAATLAEVGQLVERARQRRVALFAAWHAREAAWVERARSLLAERTVRSIGVTWKEDVREWHPEQSWIWRAGGLGVFDPGINAMSIVTRIAPGTYELDDAELAIPSNCETPIAAKLRLHDERGIPVDVALDWRHTGTPAWDIIVETDTGCVRLFRGGSVLQLGDETPVEAPDNEYPRLYSRFEVLARERGIDVDAEPLRLVSDALTRGRCKTVAPFA